VQLVPVVDGQFDRPDPPAPPRASDPMTLGVYYRSDDGTACAACPRMRWHETGAWDPGAPLEGIPSLPGPSIWVTNVPLGNPPRHPYRLHTWFATPLGELVDDWDRNGAPPEEPLTRLAAGLQRTLDLLVAAGERLVSTGGAAVDPGSWTPQALGHAGGLPSAVRFLLRPGVSPDPPADSPLDQALREATMTRLMAPTRPLAGNMPLYRASIPPLRHARTILAALIPSHGDWSFARPGPDDTPETMAAEIRAFAARATTPVLVTGAPAAPLDPSRPISPWRTAWKRLDAPTPRATLVGEEMLALGEDWLPSAMMVAGGGVPCPFAALLDAVEAEARSAPFGPLLWSVHLCATIILAAALRRVSWQALKDSGGPSCFTSLPWIGWHSRRDMAPAWDALAHAGATPVRAFAGQITFAAPADRDVLTRIAAAAWESGIALSPGTARNFAANGVAPDYAPDAWGGHKEDRAYAWWSARGDMDAIESLDHVLDLPPDERHDAWQGILGLKG